jgi:glycosyltransferase involved in cell wall biosynthesis
MPRVRLGDHAPLGVVFLTAWLGFPSGMAPSIRVRLLARAMVEAGANVHILCLQPSERPPVVENHETRGLWHGVTFEYTCGTTVRHSSFLARRAVELRGWLMGASRLVELRRAGRLDCVYLWSIYDLRRPPVVGFLRLLGVPVVMELNERPWSLYEAPTLAQRMIPELAGMDGVISISSFLTHWARSQAARRRAPLKIAEVPILVDVLEQPDRRRPSGVDPFVVFAGAPAYDETVEFIVQAMKHVWRRYPACRLVITGTRPGDPAAEALLEKVAVGAGGDDRVHLAGYLPRRDLLALYQDACALLIPLFDDVRSMARFPTKIGEYLASARPIVTTSVGEIPRHFRDGENAFVSPPGDPVSFGLKVCEVLADEALATMVGAAGREYARTHFHYALHGKALVKFFEELRNDAMRASGS